MTGCELKSEPAIGRTPPKINPDAQCSSFCYKAPAPGICLPQIFDSDTSLHSTYQPLCNLHQHYSHFHHNPRVIYQDAFHDRRTAPDPSPGYGSPIRRDCWPGHRAARTFTALLLPNYIKLTVSPARCPADDHGKPGGQHAWWWSLVSPNQIPHKPNVRIASGANGRLAVTAVSPLPVARPLSVFATKALHHERDGGRWRGDTECWHIHVADVTGWDGLA